MLRKFVLPLLALLIVGLCPAQTPKSPTNFVALPGASPPPPVVTSTWTNVTPAGVDLTSTLCSNFGTKTVQVDPVHLSNLYTSFDCQGIWKSVDYGVTWTGPINSGASLACSGGLTIAPSSTASVPIIYQSCIRASGIGFWKSVDAGVTWTQITVTPSSNQSYYPPVADPYDANHLLMVGHEFDSTVESVDAGQTWTSVPLNSGMLQTNLSPAVFFIDTGSATTTRGTWLWIGDQTGGNFGTWRTTNSGTTWVRVDKNEHVGTVQVYQPDKTGVYYMTGNYSLLGTGVLRSTDFGQTWAHVGNNSPETIVTGTAKNVYSLYGFPIGLGGSVNTAFQIAAQPGTGTWTATGTPAGLNLEGAAQIAVTNDGTYNILVGAMWNGGVWRYVEPLVAGGIPGTPTGLSAVGGNAVVNLSWTATLGATSYSVFRAPSSRGFYHLLASPSTNAYTDSAVVNGKTYYYIIAAVNVAGVSAKTAFVSATPNNAIPPVPTGVAAAAGSGQVVVSWAASAGATSYNVKRSTTNGSGYATVGSPASSPFTDASVINGTVYYYVVSALNAAGESANSAQVSATPQASANCGLQLGTAVTFCDTFDISSSNGIRQGALNSDVWGVSRVSGYLNFGQSWYNRWNATPIVMCDNTTPTVIAPNDVVICNGQLREAVQDNNTGILDDGGVTSLAMYPKQPFDFANRTGTVAFDLSNNTAGIHASWPEFWMSDLPIPDPFNHFDSWQALPANGFGIRMASQCDPGMQCACPNANNINTMRWSVDSAAVVRGYILDDTNGFGPGLVKMQILDCVIAPTAYGQMNHVEIRVSTSTIDVWASDVGSTSLRHIATVTNAGLTLTRGLVWLEDVHYNADKGDPNRPSQRSNTFVWDNLAFDGPFTFRDFSFDSPDNTLAGANGSLNLGKFSQGGATSTWTIAGLPANPLAAAARVLFSFNVENRPNPTVLNATVNGHFHSVPWPYPDQIIYSWRTFAITIPLTDLVTGTNTVQLGTDVAVVFSNVDIVLANVTGGVPVLPGSNNAFPVQH